MSTSDHLSQADQACPGDEREDTPRVPDEHLRAACEAVLMVADDPVSDAALAAAVDRPVARITQLLSDVADEYDQQRRGFCLAQVAGGWRVLSRAEHADVVARFVNDGQTARLSQAALETLAVIAYRQPVSRARIAAIRGVSVDGVCPHADRSRADHRSGHR